MTELPHLRSGQQGSQPQRDQVRHNSHDTIPLTRHPRAEYTGIRPRPMWQHPTRVISPTGIAEAPALYPVRSGVWKPHGDLHPIWRYMARGLRLLLETIAPAMMVALVINLFVAQATRVHGQSMEPTLHSDQRLVVEKLSYNGWLHLRSPQRGDVVVLRLNGMDELLIKRVIGLPGDQVEIRDGQVFINHQRLEEPYIVFPASGNYGPIDVPPLHLFVLGDNRNFSNDSRTFGPIPMKNVVGRAWFSYWPPETVGPVQ
ncbi:MAG: signal peptidase I [Anaerolineae bacterium]|nr:signal peptidase I [Anaerolineae bacterium]MDW8071716.1 signal peptidase I [Anaerolineae bacterium]